MLYTPVRPLASYHPPMRRLGETIHLAALGIWLGALVMTAASVGLTFVWMKQLEPTLGAFAGFEGDHANLGAGFITARLFWFNDIVQFVCALLVFATLGAGLALWIRRSASGVIRTIAVGLAMALVSYWLFILSHELKGHLVAYWQAASAGDDQAAARAKAAFDPLHPWATRVMGAQAVLVLISLVSGCWSALGSPRAADEIVHG